MDKTEKERSGRVKTKLNVETRPERQQESTQPADNSTTVALKGPAQTFAVRGPAQGLTVSGPAYTVTSQTSALAPEKKAASLLFQPSLDASSQEDPRLQLPAEVIAHIFSMLDDPRDLLAASAASRTLRSCALAARQWRRLAPVEWATGCWSFSEASPPSTPLATPPEAEEEEEGPMDAHKLAASALAAATTREIRIFNGIIHHLLPSIGVYVDNVDLSQSRGVTSALANAILRQTPNVKRLNLSYTSVSQGTFHDLAREGTLRKLEEINLEGCRYGMK